MLYVRVTADATQDNARISGTSCESKEKKSNELFGPSCHVRHNWVSPLQLRLMLRVVAAMSVVAEHQNQMELMMAFA